MALPPTDFTMLLGEEKTPPEMCERLHREQCLSDEGLRSREKVAALITNVLERWRKEQERKPGYCGPDAIDEIARALLESGYINSKGRRMNQGLWHEIESKGRWWKFWRRVAMKARPTTT